MARRRTVFRNEEIPGLIHHMQRFLSEGKLPDGTRRWAGYLRSDLRPQGFGYLPSRYHASARAAFYIVFSYGTPIAWVTEYDGDPRENGSSYVFHIPDVGYSPTTGQHQMAVMEAWADHMRRQGDYRRWPRPGREVVRVPGNAEVYGRTIRARSGGMDGVRPGETVGSATGHVPRQRESVYDDNLRVRGVSAYEGVSGDAMHYSPSHAGQYRAHP